MPRWIKGVTEEAGEIPWRFVGGLLFKIGWRKTRDVTLILGESVFRSVVTNLSARAEQAGEWRLKDEGSLPCHH